MALGAFARVVPGTFRTTTGTQDFTSPGIGTPKGFVVVVSWATTLSDTVFRDGAGAGWGASDGTRERASWAVSADNVGTQSAVSGGSRTKVARLLDPSDQSTALEVSFDSFITDGVRLDVTTTNGDAFQVAVLLLGGEDVECYAFDELGDGSTVTTGFQSDFVLTGFMATTDESNANEGHFQSGIATRTNPTEGMGCAIQASDNTATNAQARRAKYNDRVARFFRIGATGTDSIGNGTGIDNYTSTGFDVPKVGTIPVDGPRICGLAVKWPLGYEVQVSGVTPATTGSESKTFSGFRTSAIYACSSSNISASEIKNGAGGGVGFADLSEQRALQYTDQNNTTTANSGSRMADAVVDSHNGSRTTHLYRADWDGPLSTGFSLDWTVVNATARYYSVLALEVSPFELSGSGEVTALASSGAASQVFEASGGGSLGGLSGSGTASQSFEASGNGAIVGLDSSGVVVQAFSLAGGGSIGGLVSSGAASLIFGVVGSGELVALAASGTAGHLFSVSGGGELDALDASGIAEQVFSSAGAGELAGLDGAGAVSWATVIVGEATIPAPQASGAIALSFEMSGSGSVLSLQATGSTRLLFVAVGIGELQAIQAAGFVVNGDSIVEFSYDLVVADGAVDMTIGSVAIDLVVIESATDLEYPATSTDLGVADASHDLSLSDDVATLTVET